MPIPAMIVRTSAKSRLIKPGIRIRSEIPCTACCRTESATRNASTSDVPRSTTDRRRWFGIAISVSTTPRSISRPVSACTIRLRPSNVKGFVTTATVRIPRSLASDATTGAEPVPVPPPRPAVTKIMSAPSSRRVIASASSSAALRPISGLEPAPSPAVSFAPSCSLMGAGEERRAWLSVLATTKSTPENSEAIMRVMALLPPPPSPITLILAACGVSSSSNRGRRPRSFSIRSSSSASPEPRVALRAFTRRGTSSPFRRFAGFSPARLPSPSTSCAGKARARKRSKKVTEPTREPMQPATAASIGSGAASATHLARQSIQREPDRRRIGRALHRLGELTADAWNAQPHGKVEDALGDLGNARQDRRAAGHDDAGSGRVAEAGLEQIAGDEREDLLDPGLDDLGQDLPRKLARLAATDRRHVDRLLGGHERGERAAIATFQLFGVSGRRAQTGRDVVRHVIAAERQDER